MTPMNNPVGAFVYNAHPGLVDTILVDGVVVKRAGALVGVDPARVRRLAIDARDEIIGRAGWAGGGADRRRLDPRRLRGRGGERSVSVAVDTRASSSISTGGC